MAPPRTSGDDAAFRPHLDWADNTSPMLADAIARDPIVIVPVGSTEQHGHHLPVGTDAFAAETVARHAAEDWSDERPLLLLPTLWTGLSPHHMGLAGSITLTTSTFVDVVVDVCVSLLHHGVRRILLLNGHGGNVAALNVALARLGERGADVPRVAALTYFHLLGPRSAELRDTRTGGTGHAGEFETSLMLATHGTLVRMDEAVTCYPEHPSRYLSSDLFDGAPARRYLPFDALSPSGTLGDPSAASHEKGERIARACAEALGAFLQDFGSW
ncbi:MAG: creatininase family protein [Trueperaceae bacterium]|nr:creatininase family protein [Trueperaceae bacterium]